MSVVTHEDGSKKRVYDFSEHEKIFKKNRDYTKACDEFEQLRSEQYKELLCINGFSQDDDFWPIVEISQDYSHRCYPLMEFCH